MMDVTRKDATITNTDEEFPGSFEVVLSTPDLDRDGDELATDDWEQPLPEHITFDMDHGMSVEKTVGSGVPEIDGEGRLVVRGTYSSLPRAQEVRTLVKEGHIRTTSVAFASKKTTKDGKTRTVRELLNGAFVAIPANPKALVLSAKSGARNSAADAARIQMAHDSLVAAGADCAPMDDSGAAEDAVGGKAVTDAEGKALDPNTLVSVNLSGGVGGFDITINAWCVPASEIDAYTDTAQRALSAALSIASGGPEDDDDDESAAADDAAPAGAAAKSVDAEALELEAIALRVIAASIAD